MRRIEAVTGDAALRHVTNQENLLGDAAAIMKTAFADVPNRIKSLLEDRRELEREVSDLRQKIAIGGESNAESNDVKEVAGFKFIARYVEGLPAKELKPLVDMLKAQIGSGVVSVAAVDGPKASLVVGVTDDLTSRVDAVALVRAGAVAIGGKGGGGRPDMAQTGGATVTGAAQALVDIEAALNEAE